MEREKKIERGGREGREEGGRERERGRKALESSRKGKPRHLTSMGAIYVDPIVIVKWTGAKN